MLLFHCRATGGKLNPHPLETDGCGLFAKDQLPQVTVGAEWWAERAFAAINGEVLTASFEAQR